MGSCDTVRVDEIGDTSVIIFKQGMCCVNNECLIIVCVLSLIRCLIVPTTNTCFTEKQESAVATIVIRGATDNIMDDIERAIDDGVNTFKALTKVCIWIFPYYHKIAW